jgi:chemosensory pili system protein ChpA (sensor histidine kinase/response regulator)
MVDTQTIAGFYREAQGYLAPLAACLAHLKQDPGNSDSLAEFHRLIHLIRGASAVVGLPQITAMGTDLESYLEDLMNGVFDWDDSTHDTLAEAVALITSEFKPPIENDILEGFLIEADEALKDISAYLLDLPHNPALLLDLRRAVHTIKGSSAMVGLPHIASVAHRMEDLLDALAANDLTLTIPIQHLLDECTDLLSALVTSGGSNPQHEATIPTLLSAFDPILATRQAHTAVPVLNDDLLNSFDASRYVRVPLERIDDLVRLVSELFVHRFSFEQSLSRLSHEIGELSLSRRRFRQLSTSFEEDNLLIQSSLSTQSSDSEFDPLEFDRYTRLYTHSRDLNEATADVTVAEAQLRLLAGDFESFLGREKRLSSQLQDRLLRFRMVPLSSVAARLHRTVRVAAEQSGHPAELHIEGLTTELDKTMLDALLGPIEHLLRNAVGHGIEGNRVGKSSIGQIHLSARHVGTQIQITLSDDGAGLPLDAIRERAGLPDATTEDLHRLLFTPGFSTATDISEISGRGIGLDIVRNAVEGLKGNITLDSTPGQGTTFTLSLPLTLAITRVLLVEVSNRRFAIPLASVVEVSRAIPDAQTQSLAQLLQIPANPVEPGTRLPIATLRGPNGNLPVYIDTILEAREVVVKPLSPLLGRVPHLIGATVLADGSIAPILNPAGLHTLPPPRLEAPTQLTKPLDILIVDDSLSVRRVIAALIERQGWRTSQAKDGLEALEFLRRSTQLPDLILLDVEMPRMDGFELTSTLRAEAPFANLPIVMLTSRSSDKYRAKAQSVGVSAFLVKPYQDDHLLHTIRTLAKH